MFGNRHILTVIIVSVAILGAITAMWVFQPESKLDYKQVDAGTTTCLVENPNFPRSGVQVGL